MVFVLPQHHYKNYLISSGSGITSQKERDGGMKKKFFCY